MTTGSARDAGRAINLETHPAARLHQTSLRTANLSPLFCATACSPSWACLPTPAALPDQSSPPSRSPSQAAPASTKTYFMLQIAHRFLSNYHKLCAKCVILCILCIFVQCGLISKNPLYRDQNKALENMSMFHVWTPISPENVSQSEGREVGLQSQAVLEPKVWRRLEGRSTQTLAWPNPSALSHLTRGRASNFQLKL